jgi:hypothetical protein
MKTQTQALTLSLLAALAPGCTDFYDLRATVYYNFVSLEAPPADAHYQQFVEIGGSTTDLGCFVVEARQINCFDVEDDGTPYLRPSVVSCDCPCTATEVDLCDEDRVVTAGEIRGVVDHSGTGMIRYGGVEIPSVIDLGGATELYITVEPDDGDQPGPSLDLLLRGELRAEGSVLRGELETPTTLPVSGRVTIVPVEDRAWM